MSNYPAKMAVLAPNFVTAEGDANSSNPQNYVFFTAYSVLKVERQGRGFNFGEVRRVDDVHPGTGSIALLTELTNHLDHDDSLAGYRLDRTIAALIRIPYGDPLGATAKAPLQRLKAALANDVQDAFWYDHDRHRTLEQLANDFDLPAEWHRPTRQMNPRILEQELSAKAQSVWLSIAHEWLSPEDLRRAMADYDHWRTLNSIV